MQGPCICEPAACPHPLRAPLRALPPSCPLFFCHRPHAPQRRFPSSQTGCDPNLGLRAPPPLPPAPQVAVTKVTPIARPVLVSDFQSREDLIQALMTSCHIPFWLDGNPFTGGGGLLAPAALPADQHERAPHPPSTSPEARGPAGGDPTCIVTQRYVLPGLPHPCCPPSRVPRLSPLRWRPHQLHSAAPGDGGRARVLLPLQAAVAGVQASRRGSRQHCRAPAGM